MKKQIKVTLWVALFLVIPMLFSVWALGQEMEASPIKILLTPDKPTFAAGEPIKLQIKVFNDPNDTIGEVYTLEGFFHQPFYTDITFHGPEPYPIEYRYQGPTFEPGPGNLVPGEIILPVAERIVLIDDARAYYALGDGVYEAQVRVPFETFSAYELDAKGNLFVRLDDPERQNFDPLTSNKVTFEILPPEQGLTSTVIVQVRHLVVGKGSNPAVKSTPLDGVRVKLIKKSVIPEEYYPINHKTYSEIYNYCPTSYATPTVNGEAKFYGVSRDDWVVCAGYNGSSDFKNMGSPILAQDPAWDTAEPIINHLIVIEKEDGKKVPGKTTRLKGSELLIIEPEFMLWDSTQESYPFVFQSVGDWGVVTSVSPPQGFVADYESMSADVTNETEAVQFTITDVGSSWKETEVTYTVKHKSNGKTKEVKIKNKIGVILSKELRKGLKLGKYGHTPDPGPFKGGKKVKDKEKKK